MTQQKSLRALRFLYVLSEVRQTGGFKVRQTSDKLDKPGEPQLCYSYSRISYISYTTVIATIILVILVINQAASQLS